MAACLGCAHRHGGPAILLDSRWRSARRDRRARLSEGRAPQTGQTVRKTELTRSTNIRSRDWVCPTCGVPNHELLPDAQVTASAEASGSGTSGAEVTERSELAAEGNARPDSSESDQGAVTTPPPGPSSAAAPTAVPLPPVHGPTAAAVSTEVPPPVITEPAPVPTPTTTAPVAAPAAAPVQPTPVRTGVSSSPPPPQPGSRPVPPARAAPPASSSPPPPAPAARPQPPAPPAVTGTPSPAESGQVATEPARRGQHAPSGSPLWLDGTIAACVAVLIYLLAKQ